MQNEPSYKHGKKNINMNLDTNETNVDNVQDNTVMKLDTELGEISIEINNNNMPVGLTIKLNKAPIVLLETKDSDDPKLVLKRYPNKNVVNDDDYMNLESFGIELDKINPELIKSIVSTIEEE